MKYTIITTMVLFTSCITNNVEPLAPSEITPEFKPLPPEKLRDLRFICDGYAYKSITKKDYEQKEYN